MHMHAHTYTNTHTHTHTHTHMHMYTHTCTMSYIIIHTQMCVDEYETFRDEFGTVSTKCVSKKFNSARKKSTRERTRKSKTDHNGKCEDLIVSRPETIQPIGTLETELKCNNIQKLNSETPTLLYYKQQNQIYSTVESRNSCSSGSHDDSDMEMETQIAEITIHTED